jgi:hypothetical protein
MCTVIQLLQATRSKDSRLPMAAGKLLAARARKLKLNTYN